VILFKGKSESLSRVNKKQAGYKLGVFAETFTCIYLIFTFHKILARRYKTKFGEIDIIATRGNSLVFIEVKARKGGDKEVLTNGQMKRITNAAKQYLSKNTQYNLYNIRFDLIIFKSVLAFTHIKNSWSE